MTSSLFNPLPLKEAVLPLHKKKKIMVIAGPTAVGKTELSLKIAQVIGGEIISADSMQVYRGMDIGTAKLLPEQQGNIRHHLIDSRDLDEGFNVVDFYRDTLQAFREIFARQHVPILVGGSGFYLHALLYGPPKGPASLPEVRQKLEGEMTQKGAETLYEQLRLLDPDYAATITFRDRHKIIRALEIMTLSNQRVSLFEKVGEYSQEYDFRCWFLYLPKELLYPKIEARCEEMIAKGLIDEIKRLEKEGLRKNSSAANAIGYRQGLAFLESQQSPDDWNHFVTAFKRASRRYAKRQFTWFRRESLFRWLSLDALGAERALEIMIQDYETAS